MKRLARWSVIALSLLLSCASRAATISHEEIVSGKITREFYLVTPEQKPAKPMPLVLVLHGHVGTAANALGLKGTASPLAAWIAIADREKIAVVALQGEKGSDKQPGWNDCRADATENPDTDDVQIAHDVVVSLQQRKLVDITRLYAMGMSNGAMMSQRLAVELDPPLAAFAAVSGSLASHSQCRKETSHPVSALLIQGTADRLVPYNGGQVHFFNRERGGVLSAADNVHFWLDADHLAPPPAVTTIPHHGAADDPTRATRELYGKDAHGRQVELITIDKGVHAEPSIAYHYGGLYTILVGKQNRDFESAGEAWQFFRDKRAH